MFDPWKLPHYLLHKKENEREAFLHVFLYLLMSCYLQINIISVLQLKCALFFYFFPLTQVLPDANANGL